jgi:transcriptional regulator with XRE-family HTH domain
LRRHCREDQDVMIANTEDMSGGSGHDEPVREPSFQPQDDTVRKHKLHMIAGRIAELRRDRGWTQAELARRAGLNRNVVNTTENETSFPTRENLARMASALGIELNELTDVFVIEAHHRAPAALSLTEAKGRPGFMAVQINRMLKTATALKIFQLIAEDDADAADRS